MKKIILVLLLLIVVLLLAGCTEALVDSHMVITSKDGAGIKTINVRIPRDHTEEETNQKKGMSIRHSSQKGTNRLWSIYRLRCRKDSL